MSKLVIVESPAKAKTINKYLGKDYNVIASYGHVRDLLNKTGSVDPEHNFAMTWEVSERGKKQLQAITKMAKESDEIILATDPDREGEAISWHVMEELSKKRGILGKNTKIKRVVFNEITKSAILKAIENPRQIDDRLVNAYLARRSLDYLMGFTLSPVLWRKLPGSRSAGRVQSVALRLIADREAEIEVFKPQEYWSIHGNFLTIMNQPLQTKLVQLSGKKIEKLDIKSKSEADEALQILRTSSYSVADVQKKKTQRNPSAPFITSTMQQEASLKFGFGASKTMRLAQQLYEGVTINGEQKALISYMRTDSVTLSQDALSMIRNTISKNFDPKYLPSEARAYKTQAKNAQEAHEAIRPIETDLTPDSLRTILDKDLHRLYDLIWRRAIASQMANAELDQTRIDLESSDKKSVFRATGFVLVFDGFLKLYIDGDGEDEEKSKTLPNLQVGDSVSTKEILSEQHFTSPPARYNEASLIKKLEELGIGRPSTYDSIIRVLQDRDYVELKNKRFFCKDRGRIVTAFLRNYFEKYVEYDFTAHLESQLDDISSGDLDWINVLKDFWSHLQQAVKDNSPVRITEVIDQLNKDLEVFLFSKGEDFTIDKKCPQCADGQLSLKLSKYGSFVGCSNYPECEYSRKLSSETEASSDEQETAAIAPQKFEPKNLGQDPQTDLPIFLKKGPYGFYVQLGDDPKDKKTKPKRASLPKGAEPDTVNIEIAINLLALPRFVGKHPEDGQDILANNGRYGPYVQHGKLFASLAKDDSVLTVTLPRALELIEIAIEKKKTKGKKSE